ncbi:MAG: SRPBCC family protein [Streptosporangiaceae bacterium]
MQRRQTIHRSPQEILEFVMDIERYQQVDRKIRPVMWSRREADLTEFGCRPTLGGIPSPRAVQQLRLTPDERVDIALSPLPRNRVGHRLADFHASFECSPAEDGTEVTRTLVFRFSPMVRWFFEPILRRRLPAEVDEELRLAKEHLERSSAAQR